MDRFKFGIYFAPGIFILLLSSILYLAMGHHSFGGISIILLIGLYPIVSVLQGVFVTLKFCNIYLAIIISAFFIYITFLLYFNKNLYVYIVIYLILEFISHVFIKYFLKKNKGCISYTNTTFFSLKYHTLNILHWNYI